MADITLELIKLDQYSTLSKIVFNHQQKMQMQPDQGPTEQSCVTTCCRNNSEHNSKVN